MNTLVAKLDQILRREGILRKGERVLVACSGGPDSVALFHALWDLKAAWNWKLGLLHFNHRLRGKESTRDEKFVRQLGRTFGIPVYTGRGSVRESRRKERESTEEAARRLRYRFLISKARQLRASKVVTAHTQEDQAETVLMRILQGTGLRGLSGIRRTAVMQGVVFYRPFLDFSKAELLAYLKEKKLNYQVDRTNRFLSIPRNRIRLKLLPELARHYNPRVVDALARLARIASEENRVLAEQEEQAWKQIGKRRRGKTVRIPRKKWAQFSQPLQFRLLDRILKKLDPKSGMNFELWQKLAPHLSEPRYRCTFPRNIDCRISREDLTLGRSRPAA